MTEIMGLSAAELAHEAAQLREVGIDATVMEDVASAFDGLADAVEAMAVDALSPEQVVLILRSTAAGYRCMKAL